MTKKSKNDKKAPKDSAEVLMGIYCNLEARIEALKSIKRILERALTE